MSEKNKKQQSLVSGEEPAEEAQETQDAAQAQQEQAQILNMGSVTVQKGSYTIHCLTIIGQIEGHFILPPQNKTTKYEHVIPQLVAIEERDDIDGLIVILNTVGGDVEAGLAIAELIAGMEKPTASLVLGGGHSIGVPLAVAAGRSFIAPSATMTIHPVRMNGLVLGVPQTFSYFEQMQDRILNFVAGNSRIGKERFKELMMTTGELVMDVGTVLDGERATQEGLIDELGGLKEAMNYLYREIESRRKDEPEGGEERKKQSATRKKGKKEERAPAKTGKKANK